MPKVIVWLASLAIFFAVTYNSFQTLSEWSDRYENIRLEAQEYSELEAKKRILEAELTLLQDQEYTRIKASDSNLTDYGDTIYRIINKASVVYVQEVEEEKDVYVPKIGINIWVDLISR